MAIEKLTSKSPDMAIEMGMAGEFVLGMHGEMYHHEGVVGIKKAFTV
jgi:dimethylamine--corrinoid protein Co-methyltransferase